MTPPMARLRILLADDHAMLLQGLALLIAEQPDMEVVARASTGGQAIERARETAPDIAVLDISMPDINGAQAAKQIQASSPRTKIITLTRHADVIHVRRLLAAGVRAYVLKQNAVETLIEAVRAVAQGGTWFDPLVAAKALDPAQNPPDASAEPRLSVREEEVLRAVAWGRSNKEIATALGLSVKTVESYRASAAAKLGLRTRVDIVRYALQCDWLREG